MQARFVQPLAIGIALLLSNLAIAQEDSKSWWDFSSKETKTEQSDFFGRSKPLISKDLFKLPKMPWTSEDASQKSTLRSPTKSRSGPSMFSQMGQSTKRMWNSTVDFMNPFNDGPAPAKSHGYQPQNKKTTSGSGPLGWLWREETTETPATVNDWLRQPNPLMGENGGF